MKERLIKFEGILFSGSRLEGEERQWKRSEKRDRDLKRQDRGEGKRLRRLSNDFHRSTTMDWQRARLGAASLGGALIFCWKWRLTWETRGFFFTIFLSYRGRWKAESFTKVHRVSRPCYASFDENWKGAPQDPFLSFPFLKNTLPPFRLSLFFFSRSSCWNVRFKVNEDRWITEIQGHRYSVHIFYSIFSHLWFRSVNSKDLSYILSLLHYRYRYVTDSLFRSSFTTRKWP